MKSYLLSIICIVVALGTQRCWSQCCCTDYQGMTQVGYQAQPSTSYRLVYETVFEPRKVVSYRPVWETQTRERRYRVITPVTETNIREHRYTVRKPIWETKTRQEEYTVRVPVTETQTQLQTYTTYEPSTTTQTQYVDQGQFVNQTQHVPGRLRKRLRFLRRQYYTDPSTGLSRWQRAGLYWVPTQGKGTTQVNRVWVPKVVTQKIPKTTYQAVQKTREVQVPITTFKEQIETRDVQYKELTWKEEEKIQEIPVTTTRYKTEERVEPIQIQVCKMIAEERTIMVPRYVAHWQPVTYSYMRRRPVVLQVPDRAVTNESSNDNLAVTATPNDLDRRSAQQHSVLKQISISTDLVPVNYPENRLPNATDISSFFGLGHTVNNG